MIRYLFPLLSLFLVNACTYNIVNSPTPSGLKKETQIEISSSSEKESSIIKSKQLIEKIESESTDHLLIFLKANKYEKLLVDPQNDAFFVDRDIKKYFTNLIFDKGCDNILTPTQAAMLQGFLAKSHRQSIEATRRDILKFCADRGYNYLLRYSIPSGETMTATILEIKKKSSGEVVGKIVENMRLPVRESGKRVPWADSIVKDRSMVTKKISDLIDEPMVEFKNRFDKFCDVTGYIHVHPDMDKEQFEFRFKRFLRDNNCGTVTVLKEWEAEKEEFKKRILSRPTTFGLEFDVRKEKLSGSSEGTKYVMYYLDVKVHDSRNPHTDLSFLNAFMAIDFDWIRKQEEARRKELEEARKQKLEEARQKELAKEKAKEKLSLNVNFLYEKDGKPTQMFDGMILKSKIDYYSIYFRPDQDCYIYIYQVDSSGAVYQIFPNLKYSNNWNPVKKDKSYWIPANNDWFYLDNVTGEERLYLLASRGPATKLKNLFANLNEAKEEQKEEIHKQIRGLLYRTRGLAGVASGIPHKVIAKSGESFEIISQNLTSTEAQFAKTLSFVHK